MVEQLAARIETLKASVSSLLGRFATKEINSTELLQRLRGLGLEVNVTPESLDALPDVTDHPGLR